MTSSALSAMLQLQGLPPLPRSLTGYSGLPSTSQAYPLPPQTHHQDVLHQSHLSGRVDSLLKSSGHGHLGHHFNPLAVNRPAPPVPPPRPQSRRSSSSGSSFRASPDHMATRSGGILSGGMEMLRSSPRSLSSSPHSPHVDSGLGRSSADSSSDGRGAFARNVKSPPPVSTRLDTQLRQLKKDMHHLRQQDMALLGHLLQIHQGIQDLRQVLLPSPPSGSGGQLPLFQSTPSRHPAPKSHQSQVSSQASSRLSILSSGASKFFSRRSSSEKLMAEAMGLGHDKTGSGHRHGHGHGRRERRDDESDSLSSLEFGDV